MTILPDIVPGCMVFDSSRRAVIRAALGPTKSWSSRLAFPNLYFALVIAVSEVRTKIYGKLRVNITVLMNGRVESIWVLPDDLGRLNVFPPEVL